MDKDTTDNLTFILEKEQTFNKFISELDLRAYSFLKNETDIQYLKEFWIKNSNCGKPCTNTLILELFNN